MRINKYKFRENLTLLVFIFPATILVMIFIYIFLGYSANASLTNWTGLGGNIKFIGFKNYIDLFTKDAIFLTSLRNTVILAILFLAVTVPLGLIIAIFFDIGLKARNIFRTIYLLPLSFSFVVSATIWTWMFAPKMGTINTVLRLLKLDVLTQPWITSTKQSLICAAIVYIWQFSGFATLIYYAGISSVSPELSEAASIDGASTFQKYRYVIIPLQKPATLTLLTILALYAWKVFDLIWLMTGGGPGISSEVMSTYLYRITFSQNHFAYGAAIGIIMFIVSILTIIPFFIIFIRSQVEA